MDTINIHLFENKYFPACFDQGKLKIKLKHQETIHLGSIPLSGGRWVCCSAPEASPKVNSVENNFTRVLLLNPL